VYYQYVTIAIGQTQCESSLPLDYLIGHNIIKEPHRYLSIRRNVHPSLNSWTVSFNNLSGKQTSNQIANYCNYATNKAVDDKTFRITAAYVADLELHRSSSVHLYLISYNLF
jgi:hypothetical protein